MKKYQLAAMILCICAILISSVSATLTPAIFSATLNPGQSTTEDKRVFLPGTIPSGDVMFAFDLTGSMRDDIDVVKAQAINIMNTLGGLITDVRFGVMSFMDYPNSYSSYGYSNTYGRASGGDYAYHLDQAITNDKTLVSTKINSLTIGIGEDSPQDYSRIMYESYSDTTVGWRTGAKHILIILGDAVPHDDDINQGVPGKIGVFSTGGDPGRDEKMFTADDIDLQTALLSMSTNHIVLLFVDAANPYPADNLDYWNHWTGITGGGAYSISDASQIPTAIATLVGAQATHIHKLTLKVQEAGYTSWLTSVAPPEYDEFDIPSGGTTKGFTITITTPLDATPGTYVFHITADADGTNYGEQQVTIFVRALPVSPVGGFSVSMEKPAGSLTLMPYFALLAIFTICLTTVRRKRKTV